MSAQASTTKAGRSAVLVVNAGSSSLKLRLVGSDEKILLAEDLDPSPADEALEEFADRAEAVASVGAVGHRVVHGGHSFVGPTLVTAGVLDELDAVSGLAPLHNPPAVRLLRRLLEVRPGWPAVACFDTAFHAALPPEAATYPVPREWTRRHGIRRFGFHGLNHAHVTRRVAVILGRSPSAIRVVSCHLGGGASLCAVAAGRSVDTTMGFTPLEGVVMATRSGTVDPGMLLWLVGEVGLGVDEVADKLNHHSGLFGMSGVSADVREVLAASQAGDPEAVLAVAVYVHRLRKEIAAMAAAMGGLDALAFTGGVGENSAPIRRAACEGLGFLGVGVDRAANEAAQGVEADVTARGAQVHVLVVPAREELEIARQVWSLTAV